MQNVIDLDSRRRQRLALVLAAATVGVAVLAAVLLVFDRAAPRQWLRDPQAFEPVARCAERPQRAERERCVREVVELLVERLQDEPRLARR